MFQYLVYHVRTDLNMWVSVIVLPRMTLRKAGNHLAAGIGNVFVLLGKRISDGKQGVQGKRHRAPSQSSIVCYLHATSRSEQQQATAR